MMSGIKNFSDRQLVGVLGLLLLCQIGVWYHTKDIRPVLSIVDHPPSKVAASAFAFGDIQWYFRYLSFQLSNMGDSFGRSTSLKLYDYDLLSEWFYLMDYLDPKASVVAALASYYFSANTNKDDVRYIVDYLENHADMNPDKKWWWYYQAAYLANRVVEDKEHAIRISEKLANVDAELPAWAKFMPIVIRNELGKKEEIFFLLNEILKEKDKLTTLQQNYIFYFIQEQLKEYEDELKPLIEKQKEHEQQ